MTILGNTTRTIGSMADGTPLTVTVTAAEKRAMIASIINKGRGTK